MQVPSDEITIELRHDEEFNGYWLELLERLNISRCPCSEVRDISGTDGGGKEHRWEGLDIVGKG